MKVEGTFTEEQTKNFHRDYESKVGSVEASDYTLKVDCTNMNVITQEMVPLLEHSFQLYKNSGFHKVVFVTEKKPTLKLQLLRVAKSAGLRNAEIEEA